ncbi:MAG: Sapep family Mn(2+)-dependent dipeptidase [Clostridia bacterium]|nr:Sapep family Mn(2+)-dependent dipeptidase [Clostridia bacterium]
MNAIYAKADEFFSRKDIKEQAIKDLAEIVAVDSVAAAPEGVYPYGRKCASAIDKAIELAERYGFRTENHEYHCLSVLYGDKAQEVGIVCHLDVVPAGDGWSGDPFVLRRIDGLLMGRGAHDDKGPFIQSLYTLRFLKECGIELPFTVRLILGSDEEVGSTDLEYFVTVRKPPVFSFTPDSEFPVCIGEKGILGVNIDFGAIPEGITDIGGGTVSNAVPGKAFAVVKRGKPLKEAEGIEIGNVGDAVKITAVGKAAHAAQPESGVNAISKLLSYLIANGLISNDDLDRVSFLRDATGEYLGRNLGIACANEAFGYLTCIGGVLKNAEGRLVQSFNIRYLPDDDYKVLVGKMEAAVAAFGGGVKVASQSNGYYVSADDKKIIALTEACESVLGEKCVPYTMGGGTYARWLPNTVAFGSGILSERTILGDERGGAHQRDEYISEKEFFAGMRIYSRALGNLSEIL